VTGGGRLIATGSLLAAAGTVHAWWNARCLRRPVPAVATAAHVSVLVPARNEAEQIAACIGGLLHQQVTEILVLDDESLDGTAAAARRAAAGNPRVRVLVGAPAPPGWLGKPWACAQLAAAADPGSDVLAFVDADVRLAPGAIAAAAAAAHGADLIAPHPRQLAGTVAERLVQPLLQWSILTTVPLRAAERSPRPSLAVANGQFLLVRRDAYRRAGGHAAIRSAVLDDLALARAVRTTGGRCVFLDGSALASCRMYAGWPALRDGYGKSLWAAFGSAPAALGVVGGLVVAYVLPAAAALRGSQAGLAGYLAGVLGRLICARATGGRALPDAFAHPMSVCVFGYLTMRSLVQHRRGRLRWKGRPVSLAGR
jgi:hypothetical protein